MSVQLQVGTRKGLFTLQRRNGNWEIDNIDFLAQPVSMLLQDPRDGTRYAALNLGHFGVKLHRADEGGGWEEIAVPVYPAGAEAGPIVGPDGQPAPMKPASLTEIWALEAGGADQPGRLWAGTIPGGLFRSDDRGDSWQLVDTLWDREERKHWFGGGRDEPGIHSICVDPRDSSRVWLGISCGGVWRTNDDGATWECKGNGLRSDYVPPGLTNDPNTQDVHRLAQSPTDPTVFWIQHHNGIFVTSDDAENWRELTDVKPSVFGFVTVAHPHDSQTAWFVPGVKDEVRIAVDGRMCVTRSRDGGKTFEQLRAGLPQEHCYDIVFRHGLDVDESGEQLAMGSSTGGLWTSANGGDDWQTVSNTLPQIYCVRFTRPGQ